MVCWGTSGVVTASHRTTSHGTLADMPLGQQSGPPASPKQIAYIKALVKKAGHEDLKSARREYGLTQRQSNGTFTSREASELIDRLKGVEPRDRDTSSGRDDELDTADPRTDVLRGMPAGLLAAELARRGWSVTSPDQ